MALNAVELKMLLTLLAKVKQRNRQPRVLMLGDPDILATPEAIRLVGLDLDWDAIPKSSNKTTRQKWAAHGRDHLADLPMLDAKGVFAAAGAYAVVTDYFRWSRHATKDLQLDLNYPIRGRKKFGGFDLIVDPGTLEHCFNVAQAFANVDELLNVGGFAYHQSAAAFPNHGFWSISPTAFFDWYRQRGYELGKAFWFNGTADRDGFVPRLAECPPFAPLAAPPPAICVYTFRKRRKLMPSRRFPTQRIYRWRWTPGDRSEPVLTDFYGFGDGTA